MTSTFMHYITIPFAKEESYKEYVEKALEELKEGKMFDTVEITYDIQSHGIDDFDNYVEVTYTCVYPDNYRKYKYIGECDYATTILWDIIRKNTISDIDISKNTKLISVSQNGQVTALYDSTISRINSDAYFTPTEEVVTLNKEDENNG